MTFDTLLDVKKAAGAFILWWRSKTLKGLSDLNTPSVYVLFTSIMSQYLFITGA